MSHADPTTRGHRGLIAVAILVASTALLWFASVALARHSARSRIASEVEQLRAAGAIHPVEAAWGPKPVADDDGMLQLRALLVVCAEVGVVACGLTPLDSSERNELRDAAARVPFTDAERDAWRQYAELDTRNAAVALAREGADQPALWMEARGDDSFRDVQAIRLAARFLEHFAIVAADAGDDETARADVARLFHMRKALERQWSWWTVDVQRTVARHALAAIAAGIAARDAQRAWLEFDTELAAIDTAATVRHELLLERAELAARNELALAEGPGWAPGGERVWEWPSSWLARAQEVDEYVLVDALAARGLHAVVASPSFRFPEPATSCFPPSGPRWTWDIENAAYEDAFVAFARAALRARFEDSASASALLAQEVDALTGGPLRSRTDSDGAWTAWCAGTPFRAASPDGPDALHDFVWPPKP